MDLVTAKCLAGFVIFITSLAAGFTTFHIAKKYQKGLSLGDAFANGIFIGAALFHLFPSAINSFELNHIQLPYIYAICLALVVYLALLFFEKFIISLNRHKHFLIGTWLLVFTLSIHALVAGITLGLSTSATLLSMIFIAIIAHKGFEVFALVANLYNRLGTYQYIRIIFVLFSLVTPLGIGLGAYAEHIFHSYMDNLLIGCFDAIATGTFLYVGMAHAQNKTHLPELDGYGEYARVVTAIAGITVMGVLSIWI